MKTPRFSVGDILVHHEFIVCVERVVTHCRQQKYLLVGDQYDRLVDEEDLAHPSTEDLDLLEATF